MLSRHFRNNLRFAFHMETQNDRNNVSLNRLEIIGTRASWLVYGFRRAALKLFLDPRFVVILFTLAGCTFTSLVFYPFLTATYLYDCINWTIDLINWDYVRFTLWTLSEITIIGLGIRAFGRFSNQALMKHYFSTPPHIPI